MAAHSVVRIMGWLSMTRMETEWSLMPQMYYTTPV
jgi:hypothetical protein